MAHLNDLLVCLFMLAGAIFCLIASLGVFRMPDLYTRMQAAAKSSTLGVVCIILSVAIHFGDAGVTTRAMLVIVFLFLTAPVAAHMVARAGYISNVPLWHRSVADELRGQYDAATHELASGRPSAEDPRG
ncbi:monovalent cation/H(+) antiporter subunit G [Candidatus Laterigemmans baculatus]|uniref:monovalent cation/H(+) antiporter subunit G n=1 Tax=Candidatus Laterigemmans baculatus TaxID=2770505 RepID=UPI00193B0E77|nr:monovalent cation/H(+) antiporter subunit G [Candidatus Laterigemmans baculatus]